MMGAVPKTTYFNPRPPRGGRPLPDRAVCGQGRISIHALPAEGDAQLEPTVWFISHFNPRPPRGGRQECRKPPSLPDPLQSTPAPRRPTTGRPPRCRKLPISIHALPAEGDDSGDGHFLCGLRFQSTPSPRRATHHRCTCRDRTHFNPRPPRGGRPSGCQYCRPSTRFQSTPSPRRATFESVQILQPTVISIHALPAEGDPFIGKPNWPVIISIHALPAEGDSCTPGTRPGCKISIHALPAEGDPLSPASCGWCTISIHALPAEGDEVTRLVPFVTC